MYWDVFNKLFIFDIMYFSMIVLWYIFLYMWNCGDGENFKLCWCVFLLKKKILFVFRVEFKFNILKLLCSLVLFEGIFIGLRCIFCF